MRTILVLSTILSSPAFAANFAFVGSGETFGTGWASGRSADLDNDGDLDFFGLDNGATANVFTALNDGSGTFTDGPTTPLAGGTICVDIEVADFDTDGFPDWFCANVIGDSVLYLGNGDGSFTESTHMVLAEGVGAGDVNGDGLLDAITAGQGTVNVYLGDGVGGVSLSRTFTAYEAWDAEVADLDGNGGAEIVFAAEAPGVHVYDWDTDTLTGVVGTVMTRFSTVADLNGDGDPDLALMNEGVSEVWLNDGAGVFTGGAISCSLNWVPTTSHVVDIDDDGDLDMVDENNNNNSDTCLNDGGAGFTAGPRFATSGWTVSPGDVDNDGFSDIAVHSASSAPTAIDLARPTGPTLSVTAPTCPGPALVSVAGLTGNGTYVVLRSASLGSFQPAGGPCAGLVTGLAAPSVLRTGQADPTGSLFLAPNLRGPSCGAYLQVVDASTCTATPVAALP